MAPAAVDYPGSPCFEPKISPIVAEENEIGNMTLAGESDVQPPQEHHIPKKESISEEMVTGNERLDKGYLKYGCSHYRRRCRIRAPCCNEIFDCRHCHNEAKNSISIEQKLRHDVPRHLVEKVICSLCATEQEVWFVLVVILRFNKSAKIVVYAWEDISVQFANCLMMIRLRNSIIAMAVASAGCCYSVLLKSSHPCVERAMHQNCPVCFEYLFESRNDVIALPCGHTIHKSCLEEMKEHYQYACPICSKSVCDMSKVWEKFDVEIAATPMPPYCENKMVWILCNDCGCNSEVKYHVVAHKCPNCKSYNTRQTRGLGR
ncbi:UNVERIFIED_CONTAM: putative E3 ubiquitin-protein ligase RZFP34 [Sesamum latifolium]|uniref:E3 ubiquitin-protein ligase RZFP34 n=1 Tax=Sesamum latifolium TaxID=2727402 RepID=A0AAW2X084_9LAMI